MVFGDFSYRKRLRGCRYGVHIMMSGEFANELSRGMFAECRLIDVVRFFPPPNPTVFC